MSALKVTVLIPVFSEVDSLNQTLNLLKEQLHKTYEYEVILLIHPLSQQTCFDNIKDVTQKDSNIRAIIQKQTPGQGFAFREGIFESAGNYILMMNADLETNPTHVIDLIRSITSDDTDMVIASRWARGAHFDTASYGYTKALLNYLFQKIFKYLLKTEISDLTFCFKIGRASILKSLVWYGERHEFAMESTVIPILLGYKVKEIPTSWTARQEGCSNNKFRRNFRHLQLMLWILFEWKRGCLKNFYLPALEKVEEQFIA